MTTTFTTTFVGSRHAEQTQTGLLHKPTGQARVRIDGKDVYLGPYGSPESRDRYDEIITEWFARQGEISACTLTIDDLCLMFLDFAQGYYRRKDGTPTGTVGNVRSALRYLVQLFGSPILVPAS